MKYRLSATRTKRAVHRFFAHDGGNSFVELAVALPIVLLLVIAVVDYARLFTTGITVANAAMAGAQYGAPYDNNDSITFAAQRDAGSLLLDSVKTVRFCRCPGSTDNVNCATGNCGTYGEVQQFDSVRVRKDVDLLIPYPGLPSKIAVIRTATLRSQ
jgi:Flp pilus assembly protein TadG